MDVDVTEASARATAENALGQAILPFVSAFTVSGMDSVLRWLGPVIARHPEADDLRRAGLAMKMVPGLLAQVEAYLESGDDDLADLRLADAVREFALGFRYLAEWRAAHFGAVYYQGPPPGVRMGDDAAETTTTPK